MDGVLEQVDGGGAQRLRGAGFALVMVDGEKVGNLPDGDLADGDVADGVDQAVEMAALGAQGVVGLVALAAEVEVVVGIVP